MRHSILIPEETRVRAANYQQALRNGDAKAGKYLAEALMGSDLSTLKDATFLDALELYQRRLLPMFQHINAVSAAQEIAAIITIPGLGCGCFAGPFSGKLCAALQPVLERFLETHRTSFHRCQNRLLRSLQRVRQCSA